MQRRLALALAWTLLPIAAAEKPKPQLAVRLIAQTNRDLGGIVQVVTIYVILPDGSHAVAQCSHGYAYARPPCLIDPFRPEVRVVRHCVDPGQTFQVDCLLNLEAYYVDRRVNDITIYAANGAVRYHITGSWDDFRIGQLPLN